MAEENKLEVLVNKDAVKKRFNEVLGKRAAGFISSIISAVRASKQLQMCEPQSILAAAAVAASLQLPINSNLGFAHIVPYGGKAQFQMGWRGFVQLALRTGQYETINSTEVYEGEIKKIDRITGDIEIDESLRKSDKIIGYVAYFRLTNGFRKYFYMTVDEVTKHAKKYSKSYSNSAGQWQLNFHGMALKTVLKLLLSKFGILSIELERAVQADQAIINAKESASDDVDLSFDDNPENVIEADIKPEIEMTKALNQNEQK